MPHSNLGMIALHNGLHRFGGINRGFGPNVHIDRTTEDRRFAIPVSPSTQHHMSPENEYLFLEDAYHGTGGFKDGLYLVPHDREVRYRDRIEMAFYRNYVRPISNAKIDPVFSEQITRQITNDAAKEIDVEMAQKFLLNVDNSGTGIHKFMKRAAHWAGLHGVAFLVMDNFSKKDQPKTAQEVIDQRKFPYVTLKEKITVEDFILDDFGNILSIIFFDGVEVVGEGDDRKMESRFRQWDKDQSVRLKKAKKTEGNTDVIRWVNVDEPVVHGLGKIPVYPIYSVERTNFDTLMVPSPMYDIAKLNWTIFNLDSELRELERAQGFSILYVQTDKDKLEIGAHNYMLIPNDAKMAPGFISPDSAIPESFRKSIEEKKQAIFDIAEQNGVTAVREQASGIAKEWDFQAHGFVLKETAQWARAAEVWILDCFKLWTNEKFNYDPKYKEDFAPRGTMGLIDVYERVLDQSSGLPKTKAHTKKRMIQSAFHDSDPAEIAVLIDEIDKESNDEIQRKGNNKPPGADE